MIEIVSLSARPDLAPTVARWRWESFGRSRGGIFEASFDASLREALASTSRNLPQAFVLLEEGRPQGTAGLAVSDLGSRQDLSPWLASVYVEPGSRGRGHASRLVLSVEEEARRRGLGPLWLYTRRAEALYARLGWRRVGTEFQRGKAYALMRRDL